VEETFTAAASWWRFRGGGFRSAFNSGGFRGGGFRGSFNGNGFRHHGFAVIGSAAETSTIGPSSLAILGIRSFIIPTLTTGTIPTAIILTVTDTTLTMNLFTKQRWICRSVIGEVQLRLGRGGYYHGAIDGMRGSETRRAIRNYEQAHALPQDGRIGQRLLTTMGLS